MAGKKSQTNGVCVVIDCAYFGMLRQYNDKTEKFLFWNKFPWLSREEGASFYREMRGNFQKASLKFVNDNIEFFKLTAGEFLGTHDNRTAVRSYSYILTPGNIACYLAELVIHSYFVFGAMPGEDIDWIMGPAVTGFDETVQLASTIFPRHYSRCIGINNNWCLFKANERVFPLEDHSALMRKAEECCEDFTRLILEKEWLRRRQ